MVQATRQGVQPHGEIGKGKNMYTERIIKFFQYDHLPPALQAVSKPFCDLADRIVDTLPVCDERTVALRKLLEAKDAAVRASLEE